MIIAQSKAHKQMAKGNVYLALVTAPNTSHGAPKERRVTPSTAADVVCMHGAASGGIAGLVKNLEKEGFPLNQDGGTLKVCQLLLCQSLSDDVACPCC